MHSPEQLIQDIDKFCRQWLPDFYFCSCDKTLIVYATTEFNYRYNFYIHFNKYIIAVTKSYLCFSLETKSEIEYWQLKELWQKFLDMVEPIIYLSPISPKYVESKIMAVVHEVATEIEIIDYVKSNQRLAQKSQEWWDFQRLDLERIIGSTHFGGSEPAPEIKFPDLNADYSYQLKSNKALYNKEATDDFVLDKLNKIHDFFFEKPIERCPICHYQTNGKGHRCILTTEQL